MEITPTTSLPIGVILTLVQNEIYALPTEAVWVTSDKELEFSLDEIAWVSSNDVLIGTTVGFKFVRCINGNAIIVCKDINDLGDGGDVGVPIPGPPGPQGIQGPIGPAGPTGPKGDTGNTGSQGPQGIQGPIGLTGPQGEQGDQGIQGIQGEIGSVGPKGDKGDQGNQGLTGPQGIQGIQGPTGPPGLQGAEGVQGPQGDIGPQGPIGLTGPAGADGTDGVDGAQGIQGPQGPTGPQGPEGPIGDVGPQGPKGDPGTTGLHASTHLAGGSDPLTTAAWINVANTFSANQTLNSVDLIADGTSKLRFGPSGVSANSNFKKNGSTIEVRNGTDTAFAILRAQYNAGDITSGNLPFARIQMTAPPKLLGRGSSGAGAMEEITLGAGLTMIGTALSTTSIAPATHASTHSIGGSDPLVNAAWTDRANIFTLDQTFNSNLILTTNSLLRRDTTDGSDSGSIQINGGGGSTRTRGANIVLHGNEHATLPGVLQIGAGDNANSVIEFYGGGSSNSRRMKIGAFPFAGVTIGSTDHPSGGIGSGSLYVNSSLIAASVVLMNNQPMITLSDPGDGTVIKALYLGSTSNSQIANIVLNDAKSLGYEGNVQISASSLPNNIANGKIIFRVGPSGNSIGAMHYSTGFSWGNAVDPGAGNLSTIGTFLSTGGYTWGLTVSGATTGASLGTFGNSANNFVFGVEAAANNTYAAGANAGFISAAGSPGLTLQAYHTGGGIRFQTGGYGNVRGMMHPSGGFSWGDAIDPGAYNISLNGAVASRIRRGTVAAGQDAFEIGYVSGISASIFRIASAGSGGATVCEFINANGSVGTIQTGGSGTLYNTTSDARLKQDRGIAVNTKVLEQTIIHNFDWLTNGIAGKGIFAQEAIVINPSAVSIGTEERDAQGKLKQPWGVDYSKYVADLIVGWQQHQKQIIELKLQIEELKKRN